MSKKPNQNDQKPTADQQPMSEEQRRHHDELYNYKRDEEGTLDTSAMLDEASSGIPDQPTAGPDRDNSAMTDDGYGVGGARQEEIDGLVQ
ncbi:hypothetical protein F0P96_00600 [Hymenobacter busanensis]|uniref:Uncharacterized protein n=1 Tax=Hymenobacter busanensis TaxID=2607656 RepID=A0A7L4ZXW9_9BACT|nr:hypothetical protein [Hymenobacter busanensis]KAA9339166.1 hypothetical protein F0P96_00600 [Hymenobacter busanensis]QHJ07072.1 hypothetical protein GUY19_07150 [Hymenobacter busanensis]